MSFNKEPAVWIAAIQAVLAVAVAFGLDIDAEQMGFIAAALAAVAGVLTRTRVSPATPPPAGG